MLVLLAIILSIIGLYQLFHGRIGVSSLRTIEGTRARLVGFVLLLSWPSLFAAGVIGAIVTVFSHANVVDPSFTSDDLTTLLLPYIDLYRAIALFVVLMLALLVAYWPVRTRPRPEAMEVLPQIVDVSTKYRLDNLSLHNASSRLHVTIHDVQNLINVGELRTVETETGTLVEGKSVEAMELLKHGQNYALGKDLEYALVDLNKAVLLNPDLAKAYLVRGTIHFNAGNLEAARQDLQHLLKLQPNHPEAFALLKRINDPQEATLAKTRRTSRSELALTLGMDLKNSPKFLRGITAVILLILLFLTFTHCYSYGPLCYDTQKANAYIAQAPTDQALRTANANTMTAYVPTNQALATGVPKTQTAFAPTIFAGATAYLETNTAHAPTAIAFATVYAKTSTAAQSTFYANATIAVKTQTAYFATGYAFNTAVLQSRTAYVPMIYASNTAIAQTQTARAATQYAPDTVIANTNTAYAPTQNAQNTARVSTNIAAAPTINAQNTARVATNAAYESMQTVQNTTATPIATPTPKQSTKAATPLAQPPNATLAPKLKLPGKLIVVSQKSNQLGIFQPNGDSLHLSSVKDVTLKQAVWSPNGKQLAIAGKSSTKGYGLYVTKADGSNVQSITNGNFEITDPAWSSDGKFVAAVSHIADDWQKGMLVPQKTVQSTLDVFGVNPLSVTHIYSSNDFIESPSWSSDGKAAVFCLHTPISGFDRYTTDLYAINMDGSNLRQLTKNQQSCAPSWSPDGRQIAFVVRDHPGSSQLFLMNADGTGVRKLTDCVGGAPDWSPDGKHLVFAGAVTQTCGKSDVVNERIFIYDLDTDMLRNITPDGFADLADYSGPEIPSPSWGP